MSPYQVALAHIEKHPGTGSSLRLAKLLLSLWNGEDCGFSFRECIESLDADRLVIALGCVSWFARHGETEELVRIGHRVHELYPRVWELGIAARDAKAALRQAWEEQREREDREEEAKLGREPSDDDDGADDAAEWDSPGVRR